MSTRRTTRAQAVTPRAPVPSTPASTSSSRASSSSKRVAYEPPAANLPDLFPVHDGSYGLNTHANLESATRRGKRPRMSTEDDEDFRFRKQTRTTRFGMEQDLGKMLNGNMKDANESPIVDEPSANANADYEDEDELQSPEADDKLVKEQRKRTGSQKPDPQTQIESPGRREDRESDAEDPLHESSPGRALRNLRRSPVKNRPMTRSSRVEKASPAPKSKRAQISTEALDEILSEQPDGSGQTRTRTRSETPQLPPTYTSSNRLPAKERNVPYGIPTGRGSLTPYSRTFSEESSLFRDATLGTPLAPRRANTRSSAAQDSTSDARQEPSTPVTGEESNANARNLMPPPERPQTNGLASSTELNDDELNSARKLIHEMRHPELRRTTYEVPRLPLDDLTNREEQRLRNFLKSDLHRSQSAAEKIVDDLAGPALHLDVQGSYKNKENGNPEPSNQTSKKTADPPRNNKDNKKTEPRNQSDAIPTGRPASKQNLFPESSPLNPPKQSMPPPNFNPWSASSAPLRNERPTQPRPQNVWPDVYDNDMERTETEQIQSMRPKGTFTSASDVATLKDASEASQSARSSFGNTSTSSSVSTAPSAYESDQSALASGTTRKGLGPKPITEISATSTMETRHQQPQHRVLPPANKMDNASQQRHGSPSQDKKPLSYYVKAVILISAACLTLMLFGGAVYATVDNWNKGGESGTASGLWGSLHDLPVDRFVPNKLRIYLSGNDVQDIWAKLDQHDKMLAGLEKTQTSMKLTIDHMQSRIPDQVYVQVGKGGDLKISQDFWHALKDMMKEDDSIMTLLEARGKGSAHGISDEAWSAIKSRLETDDWHVPLKDDGSRTSDVSVGDIERIAGGEATRLWDSWMEKNENLLHSPSSNAGAILSKEDFLDLFNEQIKKYGPEIREELEPRLARLQRQVDHLSKFRSDPALAAHIDRLVSKALDHVQLDAVTSGQIRGHATSELSQQVNLFSIREGAVIDYDLTSPRWRPSSQRARSSSGGFWLWSANGGGGGSAYQPNSATMALSPTLEAGDCFCAGPDLHGHGVATNNISVMLARDVIPQHLVVEHIPASRTLDPGSAPKDLEIWAYFEEEKLRREVEGFARAQWPNAGLEKPDPILASEDMVMIGRYRLAEPKRATMIGGGGGSSMEGEATGGMHIQVLKLNDELSRMRASTGQIVVRALNNHGGVDHTCFYRLRLYGEVLPGIGDIIESDDDHDDTSGGSHYHMYGQKAATTSSSQIPEYTASFDNGGGGGNQFAGSMWKNDDDDDYEDDDDGYVEVFVDRTTSNGGGGGSSEGEKKGGWWPW